MAYQTGRLSSLWLITILAVIWTDAQTLPGLPEEIAGRRCSHERTINLPKEGKCLVPVSTAYDWTVAMSKCEQAQGKLYTLPPGNLAARPKLLRCLESNVESRFDDMWINGVTLWQPQFKWINGSVLNRVEFCPYGRPTPAPGQSITTSISVDSCVSQCQAGGFPYTVVQTDKSTLTCYCLANLSSQYRTPCASPVLNFHDTDPAYIVPSDRGSLIDITGGTTFSTSDIICASIDNSTADDGHLKSDSCFNLKPFICDLNKSKSCTANLGCTSSSETCNFMVDGRCLQTVNKMYNWYSATDDCRAKGGDLWVHRTTGDVARVSNGLLSASKYWIGATNYKWDFDANSGKLTLMKDLRTARCAHIYRKRASDGTVDRLMEWSDTPCDQGKSFLCEFDREEFRKEDFDLDVQCPWKIIDPPTAFPPTNAPVNTVRVEDDSFPWRALVSGIVASLMLLAALALCCPLCCGDRFRKPKDRVAFVPYFAGDTSQLEFETMSNADHHSRGNLRSHSEHGSQTGLVKGGHYSSHADFSSKSLDRRHFESMDKKFADLANNSYDERTHSVSYQTMPSRGNEYMTLQANMRIQDEAELEAMRRSLRGKPEVTLVTDHMDMNFTVNHAHGNSLSRSMDELHMHPPASAHDQRNRSFADIALHDL